MLVLRLGHPLCERKIRYRAKFKMVKVVGNGIAHQQLRLFQNQNPLNGLDARALSTVQVQKNTVTTLKNKINNVNFP